MLDLKCQIAVALIVIDGGGPFDPSEGICSNLVRANPSLCAWQSKETDAHLANVWRDWSKFSGDLRFPIPSGKIGVSAKEAYYAGENYRDKWDPATEYGALRIELLDFLRTSYVELAKSSKG